jgi:hypothetical protein
MPAAQTTQRERNEGRAAPFVFGISGHRDLVPADRPELRRQLDIVFDSFCAAYPDRTYELLSPLAEGADRLAAEVALARGISLLVPMPMAQPEYERDFASDGSLDEFRRMLASASASWELGNPRELEASELPGIASRDQQYAAVGEYIAEKSNVLILLWDGQVNQKVGGTAWVKMRREELVSRAPRDAAKVCRPGYLAMVHIVTPRQRTMEISGERPRIEIIGELPPMGSQAAVRSKL